MSSIAIIPARAGSKGIKDKNIIDFCGKPLIAWSILQARDSGVIDEVIVSTDGDGIADVSEKFGARVIRRPIELASDTASSEDALIHTLKYIENEMEIEYVFFLQATSPIRLPFQLRDAMESFKMNGYDSLFSAAKLEDYCLWKKNGELLDSFSYDYKNRGRRQDREPLYMENGSFYIFKPEVLFREHNRLGGKIGLFEMPFEMSYEIDSSEDVAICEYFFKRKCM